MKIEQFISPYKKRAALTILAILVALLSPTIDASAKGAARRAFKVEVSGQGRPMILIPGLSSSGEVWRATVDHYKAKYECHVLTLAGFAGEPPIEAPFLEKVRLDLASYIREMKLNRPVIVGHSLGGFLALWLASKEPELVGPLVIVDSLPFLGAIQNPAATAESIRPQAESMRNMMANQTREQIEGILKTMIRDEDKIALARKWGAASDPKTIAQAMYEMYTTDLRQEIASIKVPALVIGTWIGYKPYATREQVENTFKSQYSKLANYRLIVSDKAKHFVMYDDPEGFFAETDRFLAEQKGAR